MRHQILLREHQLWHILPQPLLYVHFMAACHMLQVASTWTYSVVVNNDLNVSAPAVVDIVLLVEALAAALGGHCGSSVCAIHALFASTRAKRFSVTPKTSTARRYHVLPLCTFAHVVEFVKSRMYVQKSRAKRVAQEHLAQAEEERQRSCQDEHSHRVVQVESS